MCQHLRRLKQAKALADELLAVPVGAGVEDVLHLLDERIALRREARDRELGIEVRGIIGLDPVRLGDDLSQLANAPYGARADHAEPRLPDTQPHVGCFGDDMTRSCYRADSERQFASSRETLLIWTGSDHRNQPDRYHAAELFEVQAWQNWSPFHSDGIEATGVEA